MHFVRPSGRGSERWRFGAKLIKLDGDSGDKCTGYQNRMLMISRFPRGKSVTDSVLDMSVAAGFDLD